MRRAWAAALALCAAADLRIETDVSLEVLMDDEPKSLRARLDEDPEHAARAFCAAATSSTCSPMKSAIGPSCSSDLSGAQPTTGTCTAPSVPMT